MTQPPHLPLPPFGDETDEALTALLDGELGAFAAERGLTEAQAREQLEQWPELAARQAELERVRAAVQVPVPPLDDVTRRRLVRGALAAEHDDSLLPAQSQRPWLRITAAAAAVLLVIAGIGAVLNSISTGSGDHASSEATSGGFEPPRGDLGDLGDVSNPATLRALLDPAAPESVAGQKSAAGTTAPAGGSAADRSSGDGTGSSASKQERNVSPTSPQSGGNALLLPDAAADGGFDPEACAARFARSRPVAFVGTGTYQGQRVTIVGLEQGGRSIAFVVPNTDCSTVLTSVSR